MSSLDKLRPIAGEHSIQEAIFTILLEDKITSPQQFKKLHTGNLKKQLPKFHLVKREEDTPRHALDSTSIRSQATPKKGKIVGFGFDDIDADTGAIRGRLRGTNDHVSWIYANILKYPGYDRVKKDILAWFRKIASFQKNMKVKAISVHYIDHLYWESEKSVPRSLVFSASSKHLPKDLLNRQGWDFENSYRFKENGLDRIAHVGILEQRNVKNNHTRFVIDMDLQYLLPKARSLRAFLNDKGSEGYSALCDRLHDDNKDYLRDMLSKDVSDMIGLNKGSSK